MSMHAIVRRALVVVAALLPCTTANAQLFRAYLSPAGVDTNPCTLPAPCRLLPAALAAVASGGEIWMLDSANYNTATVTIAKSVTILAVPGSVGSVLAIGGPAILIATPNVSVTLRNLVITTLPGGAGTYGIHIANGTGLMVDNCQIAGLPSTGIWIDAGVQVRIVDSVIRDNVGGVEISGGATAIISGSKILGNVAGTAGVWANGTLGTTTVAISDSVIFGNNTGIVATANVTATTRVSVTRSTISNNLHGVISSNAASPGTVKTILSNSMVTANVNNGIMQMGSAVFESLGNNTVRHNSPDSSGTITAMGGM
jgi:hypothetical protein